MNRRQIITLLGGPVAAWPLAARAQQPAVPVVGWLGAGSPEAYANSAAAFRKGVSELGFVEGKTVTFEYRWAEGQYDRLPTLAVELVRRPVAAILASGGSPPTRAARAASSTIPIVFTINTDPVAADLVASLNRPGGNTTGVNFFNTDTMAKQLGLLHEALPRATVAGALLNPNFGGFDARVNELQMATRSLGMELRVLRAGTKRDIDQAFESLGRERVELLLIEGEPSLASQRGQILALAARHSIATISGVREWAAAGSLMSYGANGRDAYHQAGVYIGRILKGEKPADLPVVQSTKFDLVLNLKTARALGLTVPPSLLAVADEVIE